MSVSANRAAYSQSGKQQTVQPRRPLYRKDERTEGASTNIMSDPRVVRGSTFTARTQSMKEQQKAQEEADMLQRKRASAVRRRNKEKTRERDAPPPAVEGRTHIEIQTEVYLEELTDGVIENDMCVQTDAFLDRPPSPEFVPVKTGVDKGTEIGPSDLFDFNHEVRPLLDILVARTLEIAMAEIVEEDELASLRRRQHEFEQQRNVELAEVQRLEEAERRKEEEKNRRVREEKLRVQREQDVAAKVSARGFSQHYLSDLMSSVFGQLTETGFFYDPVAREVEQQFMPWLMNSVEQEVKKQETAKNSAQALVRAAIELARSRHSSLLKASAEEEAKIAAEKARDLASVTPEFVMIEVRPATPGDGEAPEKPEEKEEEESGSERSERAHV
eukprot:TRINITY_DN42279_c0_g1_i1.p1 TRINITY_DN42279_c0_g1~~TRINITY_DN42279_c0_g1_i1.p1  ORF type:complete len:388 (+),score=89.10 TRINITY_DN42279_c0_g1_i1:114-1277(+)